MPLALLDDHNGTHASQCAVSQESIQSQIDSFGRISEPKIRKRSKLWPDARRENWKQWLPGLDPMKTNLTGVIVFSRCRRGDVPKLDGESILRPSAHIFILWSG